MKRKLKKLLCGILMVCITLTLFSPAQVQAVAKLNVSTTTMDIGSTKTIKLQGNKKAVTWTVSNDCIAMLSTSTKQAKIIALKEGTAYLNAKAGKKTYSCKVKVNTNIQNNNNSITPTVTPVPENKSQEENLFQKTYITKDKFVVEYTNNGNSTVYIKPNATFFDSNGTKVAILTPDDKSLIIAPAQTAYSLYEISSDDYTSAETSVKFDTLDGLISYTNCLDIETIDGESRVDCIVKNISNVEVNAHIVAVFKDSAGNIVYATSVDNEEDSMSEFGLQSGESSITFFSKPYDISYVSYSISYYAYDC